MERDTTPRANRPLQGAQSSASDLATLFAGQIGSKLLGLLAFAWLSRVLSPADYGLVETVVGMSLIGFMCIEFGTGTIGMRSIARKEASIADTLCQVMSARIVLAAISVPALIAVYALLLGRQAPFALTLLFGLSLLAVVQRHDWLFIARQRTGIAATGVALKMLVFLVLVVILPPKHHGLVAVGWAEVGAMVSMALFFTIAALRLREEAWSGPRIQAGFRMVRQSAALGLSGLINTAAAALPILIVTVLANAEEGGELAAAQRIVISLSTFSLVYYQVFLPLLASRMRRAPREAQRILDGSDQVVAWAGIAASVFLFLAAEPLMPAIFGDKLSGSCREFSIVLLSVPLTLAYGAVRLTLIAQDRQHHVLTAQLIAALFVLAAAAALAPGFGGEGAAVAILLGQVALWILFLWFGRHCAVRSNWRVYARPVAVGLIIVIAGRGLALNPWLEALAGTALFAMVAVLSPQFRQASWEVLTEKRN